MKYTETEIKGVYILEPKVFEDTRGYFMETYSQNEFEQHIGAINFVQDNQSRSSRGVVRGLHFQRMPHCQSKLVRCIEGEVLDIAVDLRQDSPTFGRHIAVRLSAENKRQLFIPRGFAHGFAVLSESATFIYKVDSFYCPESEFGINPFDPALGIDWPVTADQAILSPKDLKRPNLQEALTQFCFKGNLYENI